MLSKIFKKNEAPSVSASPAKPAAPTAAQMAAQSAAQAADKAAWEIKLQAALGDDAALLSIAKESPIIDIKQAAVEALTGEEALKRAEREFRDHDRRVHRSAKQRYEVLVNRRVAAVSAAKLIETAAVLLHDASIPANRLVELDRAWNALDQTLLEDKQIAEYLALWTKLSSLMRERGEGQLQAKRWLAEAAPALAQITVLSREVAEGVKERSALGDARAAVDAVLAAAPAAPANTQTNQHTAQVDAVSAQLRSALQLSAGIDARVALLEELNQPLPTAAVGQVPDAAETTTADTGDAAPEIAQAPTPPAPSLPPPASPTTRWRALETVADAHIASLLDARFAQWQAAKSDARQARSAEAKHHAKEESKAARQARSDALAVVVTRLVEQAEAALAAGHLAESTKYLHAIDDACGNASGKTNGAALERVLQTRIETLQAETARLKGWQHWGGGRVRDDLVVEAEALATASTVEKLAVKQHADAIDNLRNRWKELDKLGGATSRPLWQRFDGALKTAYLPVAEHLAKLKAVRQDNLAARNKLLDGLEAVKLTEAVTEVSADAIPDVAPPPAPAADWRALARALESFQTEWRKCGPVEHTVPHRSQVALLARLKAAIARIENPLSEARHIAQLEREKLIARAKALAADTRNREVITKVRELQTEWQAHAKTLPLMRQVENALWTEFKAATDAVFTQRDALHAARDADFKSNLAAREALIARLAALGADTAATEIKRTVADVDAEWRKCGDAPRAEAARLDAGFRTARDAAQQHLAGSAARGWHKVCDALAAKMALCAEVESAPAATDVADRWASIPALPAVWEKPLSARLANAQNGVGTDSNSDNVSDDEEDVALLAALLLQLEAALDMQSPPAFQAARRDLKLRAMKAAIEARQTVSTTNADIERLLAEAIAQTQWDAGSNERLTAIIAAIRAKPLR